MLNGTNTNFVYFPIKYRHNYTFKRYNYQISTLFLQGRIHYPSLPSFQHRLAFRTLKSVSKYMYKFTGSVSSAYYIYSSFISCSYPKCYYHSILILLNLNLRFKFNAGKFFFSIYPLTNLNNGLPTTGLIGTEPVFLSKTNNHLGMRSKS